MMKLRAEISYRYDPVSHLYEYVMLVISVENDSLIMEIYVQHRLDGSRIETPYFTESIHELCDKLGIGSFSNPQPGNGFGRWKG